MNCNINTRKKTNDIFLGFG